MQVLLKKNSLFYDILHNFLVLVTVSNWAKSRKQRLIKKI
jgi:hypothetical protein